MLYTEPLMIIPTTNIIKNWYNPNIDDLTTVLEKNEDGNLVGNLVRAYFSFSDYRSVDIISITDDNCMNSMVTPDGPTNFGSQLLVLFTQNIWSPEGEVFSKTEYGEIFNSIFPFYDEVFGGFYANDISLKKEGEIWEFIEEPE